MSSMLNNFHLQIYVYNYHNVLQDKCPQVPPIFTFDKFMSSPMLRSMLNTNAE
jgi:hypothetical protein